MSCVRVPERTISNDRRAQRQRAAVRRIRAPLRTAAAARPDCDASASAKGRARRTLRETTAGRTYPRCLVLEREKKMKIVADQMTKRRSARGRRGRARHQAWIASGIRTDQGKSAAMMTGM